MQRVLVQRRAIFPTLLLLHTLRRALRTQSARLLGLAVALACTQPAEASEPWTRFEGARIHDIRVVTEDIFDTEDPKEDRWLFRWANRLHVQTRPEVIERALLFRRGESVDVRLIEETERILRGNRYLYDVRIVPLARPDGGVDIEVHTRDTWTLDLGTRASRQGGASSGGLSITGLKRVQFLVKTRSSF